MDNQDEQEGDDLMSIDEFMQSVEGIIWSCLEDLIEPPSPPVEQVQDPEYLIQPPPPPPPPPPAEQVQDPHNMLLDEELMEKYGDFDSDDEQIGREMGISDEIKSAQQQCQHQQQQQQQKQQQ